MFSDLPMWARAMGVAWGVVATPPLAAQVRLTQQEALALAFPPPATVERRTAFLSDDDVHAARTLAGADVDITAQVVSYYAGSVGDSLVGVAYFDAHVVRTLREVLMVVVSAGGVVERVEVLSFQEPAEYEAPDPWLAQVEGRGLSAELSLKGDIVNLTGATLTSVAVVRAVRRVLALHRVIAPE